MNKIIKYIYFLIIINCLIAVNFIFSLNSELGIENPDSDSFNDNSWSFLSVSSADGDLLKYSGFNAVDGNLSTVVALNYNKSLKRQEKIPKFNIYFKTNILFDSLTIYNGYQKSLTLYKMNRRIKSLQIVIFGEDEKGKYFQYTSKKYDLKDETNMQKIVLDKIYNGSGCAFKILSTYPGLKYDDVCVSEIEFWYKGEKYNFVNLEEAKAQFLTNMIKQRIRWLTDNEEKGAEFEAYLTTNAVNAVDIIKKKEKYDYTTAEFLNFDGKGNVNFLYGNDKGGTIVDKIGEWKVDEKARLWIRIGKGEWKVALDEMLAGSDLELREVTKLYPENGK